MYKNAANILLFNIGWLVCIVYGDLSSLVCLSVFLAIHHTLIGDLRKEFFVIAIICGLGLSFDYVAVLLGIVVFNPHIVIPFWLIAIWIMFATTMLHGFAWLDKHPFFVQPLLGVTGGPLSYISGAALGEAEIMSSLAIASIYWGAIWAVLFPGFLWIVRSLYFIPPLRQEPRDD